MKRIIISLSIMLVALAFGQAVFKGGEVRLSPRLINYQGFLTDTLGNPITNPSVSMTFAIFDAVSAGNQKWTETQPSISMSKGIFHVLLGSVSPIPDSVFNNPNRWLELSVSGQTLAPRTRIVSVPFAYSSILSDTAIYARSSVPDMDWTYLVSDGADTTLEAGGRWGLARSGNVLHGNADSTHVNFGVTCTTGTSGQNHKYCTVNGGSNNSAAMDWATVGGGDGNAASFYYATVGGGYNNTAGEQCATVGGGEGNIASYGYTTVSGGRSNTVGAWYATVGGGQSNTASGGGAIVAGGVGNTASGGGTTIAGGGSNSAGGSGATVAGGYYHYNAGDFSVITGGYADTISSTGHYSYLFGINSNLTQDSTIMLDMPHVRFGTEATGYEFPRQRGVNGQVMVTNASGQLSWAIAAANDTDWIITGSNMYSGVSGNVGIGTASPGAKLHVAGRIWQTGTGQSVFLGEGAGASDDLTNNNNVFVGYYAGNSNTTGVANTASGYRALSSNIDGAYNTASGYYALYNNTLGNYNTASGNRVLYNNTTASHNIALGERALYTQSYDNGGAVWNSFNIAIGDSALYSNQPTSTLNGCYNAALGHFALRNNTLGNYNMASGYRALYNNTTASHNIALGVGALYTQSYDNGGAVWNSFNIAIGDSALYSNQPTSIMSGLLNTALGHHALRNNTLGFSNTASGYNALYFNTTGTYNSASGASALFYNMTGNYNTASGASALLYNTSGLYNTAVGYLSGPGVANDTLRNTSALGYLAQPNANNRVFIGNTSITWIGGQVNWSTYSDQRAKSDVRDNIPGLEFITRLKPVSFKLDIDELNRLIGVVDTAQWNGKYDLEKKRISGFLAQDVARAARECDFDFSGIDSTADVYSLSYAQFVVPLVKAVQEQQTQIEKQQTEIVELRAMIAKLENRIK